MIKIRRTPEPDWFAAVRETQLKSVGATKPTRTDAHKDAYKSVRSQLVAMQRHKCCYCECHTRMAFNDVEHYRPFSKYWWLAWTWENLMFACELCNRVGKNDAFPLKSGSMALRYNMAPPAEEIALFLNPTDDTDDPRRHIQFVKMAEGRWLPTGLTDEGETTLSILMGDEWAEDYLNDWTTHVQNTVMPAVRRIRRAMGKDDFVETWRVECEELLHENMPLRALSEDVLRHEFKSFPDPPAR